MELAARDRALQRYCVERRRMGKRRQSFRGSLRAAGAAGRRGGGTLLRGFVWTRVDAADARMLSLSVFSRGESAKVKAMDPRLPLRFCLCRDTSRTQSDDPTTTQSHLAGFRYRDPEEVAP